MATTMNYGSLISDMQNYLERGGSEITDQTVFEQLPRLINQAERRLADMLKLLGQIEVLTGVPPNGLQTGSAVVTKPDRWRKTVSFCYGTGATLDDRTFLLPRALEYCTAYWPNRLLTSPPLYYADYDLQHWLISPTPDLAYPFEIIAYMLPVLLDTTNQTNFWTNYTPALLLYSALIEAEPFLKDDSRIAVWQGEQAKELSSLTGQDMQRIMDRASQRTST